MSVFDEGPPQYIRRCPGFCIFRGLVRDNRLPPGSAACTLRERFNSRPASILEGSAPSVLERAASRILHQRRLLLHYTRGSRLFCLPNPMPPRRLSGDKRNPASRGLFNSFRLKAATRALS